MSHHSRVVPYIILVKTPPKRTYEVAELERAAVLYHTAQQVKVRASTGERHVSMRVWCSPTAESFQMVVSRRDALAAALATLKAALSDLGYYSALREEVEQVYQSRAKKRNPLSRYVIHADRIDGGLWNDPPPWMVTHVRRNRISRHTDKMYASGDEKAMGSLGNAFFCPTERSWKRIELLHAAAQQAKTDLEGELAGLGTYAAALDGRYLNTLSDGGEALETLPMFAW